MSKARHLPSNYQRIDEQINDTVVDAIELSPRSSGRLTLPGAYSSENQPPHHRVRVSGAGPGVEYEQKPHLGSPESFRVTYEVKNFRDSIAFAQIELVFVSQ